MMHNKRTLREYMLPNLDMVQKSLTRSRTMIEDSSQHQNGSSSFLIPSNTMGSLMTLFFFSCSPFINR
ncbi:hypothetical protein EPI10_020128 [Gossypium australe]|uniref:Uncharacterized protein n=1 Tax=Gossypium australe TaxID=47621 RepID=A0A5B6WE00_9ROSI|nr:hypothetical protein EPI10_020128 [Gossypium australe]